MVTEQVQETAPGIAEGQEPPSPEAAPEAAAAAPEAAGEETQAPPEETKKPTLAETLHDMTAEEFDAFVEALPEEVRDKSTVLAERERRAEQRGRTRIEEEMRATQGRQDAFSQFVERGQQAAQALDQLWTNLPDEFRRAHRAIDDGDTEALKGHISRLEQVLDGRAIAGAIQAYRDGEVARLGQARGQDLITAFAKYTDVVRTFTSEEAAKVEAARYQDAQKGGFTAFATMLDIVLTKATEQAESRGVEKGRKRLDAEEKLLERALALRDKKGGTPPPIPTAGSGGTMTFAQFEKLPLDEQAKVSPEERQRIYQRDAEARNRS